MSQLQFKLENLLSETNESYYWLGFLLADGHFSDKNRLSVVLSAKDTDHLTKFLNFLETDVELREFNNTSIWKGIKNTHPAASIKIMDTNTLQILKERYDIKSDKTHNPPKLKNLTNTQKFCLMVGFIDGDGSVQYQTGRTDCKISIKCHSTWKEILEYLFGSCRINNAGYAYHCTADNEIIREWKREALKLNLPLMSRKWDKVDLQRVSKYRTAENWQSQAISLFNLGLSMKEICLKLDKKYTTVYQALARKNLIRKEV
jgi:hypothetical protein